MADKKISELTSASAVADADVLPIVQGNTTKKVSVLQLRNSLSAFTDIDVDSIKTEELLVDGVQSLSVDGVIDQSVSITVCGASPTSYIVEIETPINDGHVHIILFNTINARVQTNHGLAFGPTNVNSSVTLLANNGRWFVLSLVDVQRII